MVLRPYLRNKLLLGTGTSLPLSPPGLPLGSAFMSEGNHHIHKVHVSYKIFVVSYFIYFSDRVSLCSSGCSGIYYIDQSGL